jgi:uncharacterized membrane protein YcaP (DUF421 family)
LIVFFRTLILYSLVVLVMRLMGKRQIGELQPFELVIAIMISELAAVPMADTEIPLLDGIIPILTLLLAQVSIAYLTLKSKRARTFICGRPSILIEKGTIIESELRRLRINLNDLLEQLRVKNFTNIADVDYAILETNGQMSIIPKSSSRPIITEDLGINPKDVGLPLSLVLDGYIEHDNLKRFNLTEEKLLDKLSKYQIKDLKELFFVSIDKTGKISWQRKKEVN